MPATRPGPTGYVLNWQLKALGMACEVIAPSLIPVKLARSYRAGDPGSEAGWPSQQRLDEETKAIAWKAQWRLCTRYKKMAARGREKPEIVVALGDCRAH